MNAGVMLVPALNEVGIPFSNAKRKIIFIPNYKALPLKSEGSEIFMPITLESVLGGRGIKRMAEKRYGKINLTQLVCLVHSLTGQIRRHIPQHQMRSLTESYTI